MPDFNYAAFFRRLQDLKQLQIKAEEVSWIEKHQAPDRTYDTVLYLGCNILRTPHIAKQVIAVFTHLGLDFIPVGGVQFCCGIVWDKFDGPKKGSQVSDRTVGRLESYQPKQVVMWCPSCNVHFKDIVIGRDSRQPQFEITHTTKFLSDMVQRGEIAWKQSVPSKVALHTHVGRTGHEEGQRRASIDRESAAILLGSIPGIELLDEIQSPPELDYDCGAASLRMPPKRFREIRTELGDSLKETSPAETLATISHACHREWCEIGDANLTVRNYISIVAEALGLETEQDQLGDFKKTTDLEEILDRSRDAWESHGLSREQARDVASKYFADGAMAP